jgi:hypothetical protein
MRALGIPSAFVHLVELRADSSQLARVLARGSGQRDVDRTRKVLDDEHVAELVVVNHVRCRILILVIDSIDVSVGRLGDMRVGGDDWLLHRMSSIGFAWSRTPDRVFGEKILAAEICITRALRALQRRGYIPIGQDRDEPRGNRQQIARRESRARRPAPLWIRASQTIEAKGASSRPASSGSFAVIVSPAHSPVLGQG